MYTDDLSTETYKAVLITSEKFNHNLYLQFGLLADGSKDDNYYLAKANILLTKWKSEMDKGIPYIFFDVAHPVPIFFEKVLIKIQQNIEKVQNIPIKKRHFEY